MRMLASVWIALVLALGLGVPSPASAATPGGNGKIVYIETETEFTSRLVLINSNGTGRVPLTTGHFDSEPDWSPSGLRIAFVRYAFETSSEIYAMDANGANVVPLTNEAGGESHSVRPAWSPDGTRIAYERSDADDFFDIWIMNANGTGNVQLTFDGASGGPIWAPDGSRIHFHSGTGRYSMRPDWTDIEVDPVENALCYPEDWFPSMARVTCVIVYQQSPPLSELVTVRPDGSNEVTLTGDQTLPGEINNDSSVSPDGTKVVFVNSDPYTIQPTPSDLYVLNADGSGSAVNITAGIADAFMPDWQPAPAYRFSDIATSPFKSDINWLADEGIASGCGGTRFCPLGNVTRGQMASFLARALALPSTATDYFTDDETSIHETDINRVRAAGIATGCGGTNYCPTQLVTRGQMASFLARGFSLPSATLDYFTDDETSIHEPDINRVAKAGITSGCTATTYCPLSPVTRGQMAAFLHRALD